MTEHNESQQPYTSGEEVYHYPWLRTVMIIVVYGALMVFLWHFPSTGGRTFFRTLFRGLLYVFAGVGVVGVTLLLLLFVLPSVSLPPEEDGDDEDEDYVDAEDIFIETVFPARAIVVPAFRNPETEPRVWETLYELEEELGGVILADAYSGVVAVTEGGADDETYNIRVIRERLRRAGIASRKPR